jgi:putative transposase
VLERLVENSGTPESIGMDNSPECISEKLKVWCEERGICLLFIQQGKPVEML